MPGTIQTIEEWRVLRDEFLKTYTTCGSHDSIQSRDDWLGFNFHNHRQTGEFRQQFAEAFDFL